MSSDVADDDERAGGGAEDEDAETPLLTCRIGFL